MEILTGTPPELTYGHDIVRQAWTVVWATASGALAVIIGWMGLSLIVSEHLGRQRAGWRETITRLVLGLVAAASSLWWCARSLSSTDARPPGSGTAPSSTSTSLSPLTTSSSLLPSIKHALHMEFVYRNPGSLVPPTSRRHGARSHRLIYPPSVAPSISPATRAGCSLTHRASGSTPCASPRHQR